MLKRFNPIQRATPPPSEGRVALAEPPVVATPITPVAVPAVDPPVPAAATPVTPTVAPPPAAIRQPVAAPAAGLPAIAPGATAGIKKLNLAGFAKKKETGSTSDYPIFPDPSGHGAEAAAAIRQMQEEYEALEGSLKTNKKFLIELTAPFLFANASGKIEPAKAVIVEAGTRRADGSMEMLGTKVRVDFKHKYPVLDDDSALLPLMGDQLGVWFRQKFSFAIDGDKLPADKVEELLFRLQRLFADFNATDALTVKSGFAPIEEFHVKRHTAFTPEQNLALQAVCPIQAAVATKNLK